LVPCDGSTDQGHKATILKTSRHLADRVGMDGADAEYAWNHVSLSRFEAHRYLLLIFHKLAGQRVFHVEEAYVLLRTAPLNRLFAEPRAVSQDSELSLPSAGIIAVGHDQDHGMGWIHSEIKREPLIRLPAIAPHELNRRGVLALLTEVSFRLHLARLGKRHRRRFQLLFPIRLGCVGLRHLLPFGR